MWILKPNWITHDPHQSLPILSVDIEPQMTRFLTACIDNSIIVWSLKSILEDNLDDAIKLATLNQHLAPVNCVRWSPSGVFFASASDDKLVIVWERYEEMNGENWRAWITLTGHSADVKDIAWSPDGAMLASGSVDNHIIIWNVANRQFAPYRVLDAHTGYVNGLAFDPFNRYLASLGDDKLLCLWSTTDWEKKDWIADTINHSVNQQLKRLAFTPDGMNLILPGPKKEAYKYMATVLEMTAEDDWEDTKYLVGHLQPVSVVKTCPVLFKGKEKPDWAVALGGYDSAISIWKKGDEKPIVIKDLFSSAVADLAWSSDGKLIMGCSSDGTVVALYFDKDELGEPLTREAQATYLESLAGFKPIPKIDEAVRKQPRRIEPQVLNVQKEERTESGRRRIQPIILSTSSDLPPPMFPPYNQAPSLPSVNASPLLPLRSTPEVPKQSQSLITVKVKHEICHSGMTVETESVVIAENLNQLDIRSTLSLEVSGEQIWKLSLKKQIGLVSANNSFIVVWLKDGYIVCLNYEGNKILEEEAYVGGISIMVLTHTNYLVLIKREGELKLLNMKSLTHEITTSMPLISRQHDAVSYFKEITVNELGKMTLEVMTGERLEYNRALEMWVNTESSIY